MRRSRRDGDGGIPLVTVLSQLTGLPAAFVRKEPKAYGTRKIAEGRPVTGLRVVGVEDVVTTGGALIKGCNALRENGAILDTVVCAIDREQVGQQTWRPKASRCLPP